MRTIKFKLYWQHEDTGYINTSIIELKHVDGEIRFNQPANNRRFVFAVCQFTGLLDIDGIEIYEGDIVQPLSPRGVPLIHTWEVFYDDKYCIYSLRYIEDDSVNTMPLVGIVKEHKVIGNIYDDRKDDK